VALPLVINVHARAAIGRALAPLGERLAGSGISPDVVTVAGTLGVTATAIGLLATGHFVIGPLVLTVFALSDMLDGLIARHQGIAGPWGAFLDSSLDRVGDAAVFGSLAFWWFTRGGSDVVGVVALVCLVAGSLTSYVKARAEGLGLSANVGIAERAERLILTLVALFLEGVTGGRWIAPAALWLLAGLSLVTVAQRFREVRRQAVAATVS